MSDLLLAKTEMPKLRRFNKAVRPLPGVSAYYPLNESTGSTAFNRAIATLGSFNGSYSGVSLGQPGRLGKAVSFNGVDDFINLNATNIIPHNTGACSIFAIINSFNTGAIQAIVGNRRDSTTLGWLFKISSNNRLEFSFFTGNLFSEGSNRSWGDVAGMEVPNGKPCFVGVTFDGNTAKFYINNREFIRETLTNRVNISENTAQNIRIGHRQAAGAGQEFFNGSIQHVGIISGYALSKSQMLRLASTAGLAS